MEPVRWGKRMFDNDAAHLPISTGSALVIYGWTAQEIILFMWGAYVFMLIVAKLPEFTRSSIQIFSFLSKRWERLKEWKRGSKN